MMRSTYLLTSLSLTVLTGVVINVAGAQDPTPAAGQANVTSQSLLIVVGAGGTAEFGEVFQQTASKWREVGKRASAEVTTIGIEKSEASDAGQLQAALTSAAAGGDTLWVVLIGHGTFDGQQAKFNLRGPDATAEQMLTWLEPIKRSVVLINGASSSAPFINKLSGPNRVIVTATDSGYELNYARFGIYLADAMISNSVDLDKDEQTSILEAFLAASKQTAAFYADDGRMATEHALIDDNGDALGTSATFFRGVRVNRPPKEGQPDGFRANQIQLLRSERERSLTPEQRAARVEVEKRLEVLRGKKTTMPADDYYAELERLFLELADVTLP
jgi:hypothetical protein